MASIETKAATSSPERIELQHDVDIVIAAHRLAQLNGKRVVGVFSQEYTANRLDRGDLRESIWLNDPYVTNEIRNSSVVFFDGMPSPIGNDWQGPFWRWRVEPPDESSYYVTGDPTPPAFSRYLPGHYRAFSEAMHDRNNDFFRGYLFQVGIEEGATVAGIVTAGTVLTYIAKSVHEYYAQRKAPLAEPPNPRITRRTMLKATAAGLAVPFVRTGLLPYEATRPLEHDPTTRIPVIGNHIPDIARSLMRYIHYFNADSKWVRGRTAAGVAKGLEAAVRVNAPTSKPVKAVFGYWHEYGADALRHNRAARSDAIFDYFPVLWQCIEEAMQGMPDPPPNVTKSTLRDFMAHGSIVKVNKVQPDRSEEPYKTVSDAVEPEASFQCQEIMEALKAVA